MVKFAHKNYLGEKKMKRKTFCTLQAAVLLFTLLLAGCAKPVESPAPAQTEKPKEAVKVGMVTDAGTINDQSFNQGTWEAILRYKADTQAIEEKYLQPSGEQRTDYLNAINKLTDAGYKIIVTPGYKFETAINEAADKHKDVTFILIDGLTHKGDNNFIKHDNVVCVLFNEQEAAFLAGVAAALSSETGKLGFIGGIEYPPVQRFGWGFTAGVKYAQEKYGAKAKITDYIYQGTFSDIVAGRTLASAMYKKGIDIIFAAAGGVGNGVFNEAKGRAEKGEKVKVVGVDVDQYEYGKLSGGKSVTLTSAMKRIDIAAYNYIDAKLKGEFPGGQIITLSLADNGVGLPVNNPNLSDDIIRKVEEARRDILEKKIVVPANEQDLNEFLK